MPAILSESDVSFFNLSKTVPTSDATSDGSSAVKFFFSSSIFSSVTSSDDEDDDSFEELSFDVFTTDISLFGEIF